MITKDFSAFKMSKSQMNAIAGGAKCSYLILLENGDFISETVTNNDMNNDQLYDAIHDKYDGIWGAGNVIVNCP